jgi:chorismate mutase
MYRQGALIESGYTRATIDGTIDTVALPGLKELRESIDEVDKSILLLLKRRFELVLQVGELKREHQAGVYDAERERRVLDALARAAEPPLSPETARRIFERIIDESRSQEQRHVQAPKAKG